MFEDLKEDLRGLFENILPKIATDKKRNREGSQSTQLVEGVKYRIKIPFD
jgi:hypothetical protein